MEYSQYSKLWQHSQLTEVICVTELLFKISTARAEKLVLNVTNATEPQSSKDCGVRPYVPATLALTSHQIHQTVYLCFSICFL